MSGLDVARLEMAEGGFDAALIASVGEVAVLMRRAGPAVLAVSTAEGGVGFVSRHLRTPITRGAYVGYRTRVG